MIDMALKDDLEHHKRVKGGTEDVIDFLEKEIEHRENFRKEYAEKCNAIGEKAPGLTDEML